MQKGGEHREKRPLNHREGKVEESRRLSRPVHHNLYREKGISGFRAEGKERCASK